MIRYLEEMASDILNGGNGSDVISGNEDPDFVFAREGNDMVDWRTWR